MPKTNILSRKIRFAVQDSGIGIREQDYSKLFKVFGKVASHSDEANPQGIGLGLTICN